MQPSNEILAALAACRRGFVSVGAFSAVINLLMLAPALYMLQVYDRVLASGNHMTLAMLTLMVLGLYAFMGLLEWVRSLVVIRLGAQVDQLLGGRVYDATFDASLRVARGSSAQPLNDLTSLRQFATGNALFALFDAPWFPLYLAVLFLFHPWLGWLALGGAALLLVLSWANQWLTRVPLAEAGQLAIHSTQAASAQLRNAEATEAMGMLARLRQRWQAEHGRFLQLQNRASEQGSVFAAASKGVRLALQSLMLGLGALLAVDGQITPGMMIAGSILTGRVLGPLDQLIGAWKHWSGAQQAYQRLRDLLQAQPPRASGMSLPAPRGELRVEQLSACAPGSRTPVLAGVSFALEPGQRLVVLGPSGCGKSSLARLLVAAQVPLAGKVRLDGADLQQWDKQALGPHLGYLPQDVQLFAGSIAENIARFTEVEADKVIAAAQMAGVHELILRLPQGYDTCLGEGGAGLSGGQKQRIGLARAVYGLPALIVLDEPDANLDEAGEQSLLAALDRLREQGRTLVLVSHRPTLLKGADQLLVLRAGQMQAFGPAARVLQDLQQSARPAAQSAPVRRVAPALSISYGAQPGGQQ
ncbi:type I secretion system permease/ATPase [Ectopseudomonas toyotomiensis]|uniref:Type I secretion system permease/ATPase n=1 Tax=Ectopseudomonas toyotomiensis TaxID=554344 RepID=A0AA42LMY4_9GAMM|nr:type I secretion system permease/ATPase [Pseudomonas toyotomiensis]MBG0839643.1 type I secretion system permease/ATPase [Pseudomonas toyotomiensis]MDH0704865.1 type I secretion system permease/ATPase [Pseudomonas toyotomiensis]